MPVGSHKVEVYLLFIVVYCFKWNLRVTLMTWVALRVPFGTGHPEATFLLTSQSKTWYYGLIIFIIHVFK